MKAVEVGRITRPHGLRGEVRVHLHFEESDTLAHVDRVMLERNGSAIGTFGIVSARPVNKAFLLLLEGVRDCDAAEKLRGASVSVPRDALPPLADGEYYLCDLLGAKVLGPDGPVGDVVDLRVHPSADALVVRTPDGRTLEQPLVPPFVARVDAEAGVVELASTEGLI